MNKTIRDFSADMYLLLQHVHAYLSANAMSGSAQDKKAADMVKEMLDLIDSETRVNKSQAV